MGEELRRAGVISPKLVPRPPARRHIVPALVGQHSDVDLDLAIWLQPRRNPRIAAKLFQVPNGVPENEDLPSRPGGAGERAHRRCQKQNRQESAPSRVCCHSAFLAEKMQQSAVYQTPVSPMPPGCSVPPAGSTWPDTLYASCGRICFGRSFTTPLASALPSPGCSIRDRQCTPARRAASGFRSRPFPCCQTNSTSSACRPFGPRVTVNETRAPSSSER